MKKILVPVDFESHSIIALEQSYNLARLLPAEIVLLYVYDQPSTILSLFSASHDEEIMSKLMIKLEELASDVRSETGLMVTALVAKGRIYSKILETAGQVDAQFIVMGQHSEPDLPGSPAGVMGANSSRVLRSTKCPVITINAKHHYDGCRNILLPIDLTRESRQKVNWAVRIARIYGAGIKVVSGIFSTTDPAEVAKLKFLARQVTHAIEKEGVSCTVEVIENIDGEKSLIPSLLNYVQKQGDIDLIMIMTQQEAGLIEYFMGSVAQEFVRLSPIPVMSIVPRELGFVSIFD